MIIAIGQAIFCFGVGILSYPVALLGRAVYGLGGECLNVVQINAVSDWFTKNDRSMAVAVIFMVRRLTTALNDNITPNIVESTSLTFGLWLGFFVCVLSFCVAFVLKYIEHHKNRILQNSEEIVEPQEQRFRFSEARHFGISFWLLAGFCGIMETVVFGFNNVASKYFQTRFGYNTVDAGRIISITFLISGVCCPITGMMLDSFGRRIYYILVSAILLFLAHTLLLVTPDSTKPAAPVGYMVLLGLGFSISSTVIFSSISYLVGRGSGTAFGINQSILNTMFAIAPVFVGYINDSTSKDHGFYWVSVFFVCLASIGIIISTWLYFANKQDGTLHIGKIKGPNVYE